MRRFYFKNTLKMKNLTIIGILLLGISGLLFYMTTNLEVEEFTLSHFMGIMGGVGIGLTQITQLKFFEISLWGNPKFRRTIFCVFW